MMDEWVLYEDVNAGSRIYFDLNMNNIVCMCIKMCIPVTCESLLSSSSVNLYFHPEAHTANFVTFFTLDKPVGMWLLKAVYMYSVYLKFCKLKFKTVCVLKFTAYNVKNFIYYRKYKASKTFCV